MTDFEYYISFQLPTLIFYGLITFGILIVVGIAVHLISKRNKTARSALNGARALFGAFALHNVPTFLIVALWTSIAGILVIGLFGLIFDILQSLVPERPLPGDASEIAKRKADARWEFRFKLIQLTAFTTVLGAVIALPITMSRLRLQQSADDTARESLFNEKINAATQGLYARRQVTKRKRKVGYVHIWQDDIVQRCAAIDRLEGLAEEEENADEVPRIARLLSVYVRELSVEAPAKSPPDGVTQEEMREWTRSLPKLRSDMEKAAQTLGRLHKYALQPLGPSEVDLNGANLQNCDVKGLTLNNANLQEAQLQGANLQKAQLQGANLLQAEVQGANLVEAQLQGAYLQGAQFDHETSLTAATLRGAAVREVNFTNVPQIMDHLDDVFGDASVTLPNGIDSKHADWPAHWPKQELDWQDFDPQWRAWQKTLPEGWDKRIPKP